MDVTYFFLMVGCFKRPRSRSFDWPTSTPYFVLKDLDCAMGEDSLVFMLSS